jgi:cytosine/creatinine deaminase
VLLTGGRDGQGAPLDVLICGETIAATGAAALADPRAQAARRVDMAGRTLLPAAAEPHAHLDKALLRGRAANRDGTLDGALSAMRGLSMTSADILDRARRAAEIAVRRGFTAIRSHVDVGGPAGTAGIEALVLLRQELSGQADVQVTALTAGPLAGREGLPLRGQLRAALDLGCDVVGGAPWHGQDAGRSIDELTAAAADAGCPIDLHLDETTDAGVVTVARYADRVAELGLGGRAVASHCVSLGQQDPGAARKLSRLLAASGVAVVVLPQTNLALQGRQEQTRVPRALPPVGLLEEAGVVVAAGGDNWQDPFNPVGRIDPMETAALLSAAGHLTPGHAYSLVSERARTVLGLPPALLRPGDSADFIAVRADDLAEAVAGGTEDRIVWRRGRQVARTSVSWVMGDG